MVYLAVTGALMIAVGGYVLVRPMSIRSFPSARQWDEDPDGARREQRAYAGMTAFFLVLGGLVLLVLGLAGWTPDG